MQLKTYEEVLDYLYNSLPIYQKEGEKAFNAKLDGIINFCESIHNPQNNFKTIHVAGTNGKGSTAHIIAGTLTKAGYKVGLYTSPHLKDFTERVRIDGIEVDKSYVIDFVNKNKHLFEKFGLSFFEMTVALAFDYFSNQKVDVAVIEVGLGGRLDATNIITPILSVITNIGLDHQQILGETVEDIAVEKAGIIKQNVPVVIGMRQEETNKLFDDVADEKNAEIFWANDRYRFQVVEEGVLHLENSKDDYKLDLKGQYQTLNLSCCFMAFEVLRNYGFGIYNDTIKSSLLHIAKETGLKGRWQCLGEKPLTICDTGHNEDGVKQVVKQIKAQTYENLWILWSAVRGKDHAKILSLLPSEANLILCEPNMKRAESAENLLEVASDLGFKPEIIKDVNEALGQVRSKAKDQDMIFVGGSTFLVAEINEL